MIFHESTISTSALTSQVIQTLSDSIVLICDGCKFWFETQGDLWNVHATPEAKDCTGNPPNSSEHIDPI